jgi:hypothetical protein
LSYPDRIYQEPKSDYVPYFYELHKHAGGFLDHALLYKKNGYSFAELMDISIQSNKKLLSLLEHADVCVLMHATYEYDANYANIGSYLKDHYAIKADLFDMAGQGGCDFIPALHFISAIFAQSTMQNALIIGFEQRALPLRLNVDQLLPGYNGIGFINVCSNHLFQSSMINIIKVDFMTEKNLACELKKFSQEKNIQCYVLTQQKKFVMPESLVCFDVSVIVMESGILPMSIFLDLLKNQIEHEDETILHVVLIETAVLSEWGVLCCTGQMWVV